MTTTPPDRLTERHAFAQTLIRDAGRLALDYFERFETLEVHSKGVQDMASEADLAVERLIQDRLAEAFPTDDFFGEETGPNLSPASTGIWVVDGFRPDRYDVAGALICLLGVAVIMYSPRVA